MNSGIFVRINTDSKQNRIVNPIKLIGSCKLLWINYKASLNYTRKKPNNVVFRFNLKSRFVSCVSFINSSFLFYVFVLNKQTKSIYARF